MTRLKPGLFIITGVIYPITELYDVPLVVFRGFSSETFTFEAVEAREKDSRPYWVYYLGDFDPSGHDAALISAVNSLGRLIRKRPHCSEDRESALRASP